MCCMCYALKFPLLMHAKGYVYVAKDQTDAKFKYLGKWKQKLFVFKKIEKMT